MVLASLKRSQNLCLAFIWQNENMFYDSTYKTVSIAHMMIGLGVECTEVILAFSHILDLAIVLRKVFISGSGNTE